MGQTEVVPAADYEETPGGIMKQIQRNRCQQNRQELSAVQPPGIPVFLLDRTDPLLYRGHTEFHRMERREQFAAVHRD